VVNMVGEAPDETLIDLAQHVGFSFEMGAATLERRLTTCEN